MPNANRPSLPADTTKWTANTNKGKQPHDNMAPFSPAPIQNCSDGGSHSGPTKLMSALNEESEGTGRC